MPPDLEALRDRLRAFLGYLRPKLLHAGADTDRMSQLRRLGDVRIRQFAIGKPSVTACDLCELLSDPKSGRFDALAEATGLLQAPHLTAALAPLGEEMGYVVEGCLTLQVIGAAAMRAYLAGFVKERGPLATVAPLSSHTLPSFKPPPPLPPDVQKLLGGVRDLWVAPANLRKIVDLLSIPGTAVDQVGAEIERDPPLAAQVLRLVNALGHAANNRSSSVKRALVGVGYPAARRLVPLAALVARAAPPPELAFDLKTFWTHSLTVAYGALLVARASKVGNADDHFAAGLGHDLGKMVLARFATAGFKQVLERKGSEEELLGVTHAAVGASVAERWGMPPGLALAMRHHLTPLSELEDLELPREALVVAGLCRGDDSWAPMLRVPPPQLKGLRAEAGRLAAAAAREVFSL